MQKLTGNPHDLIGRVSHHGRGFPVTTQTLFLILLGVIALDLILYAVTTAIHRARTNRRLRHL